MSEASVWYLGFCGECQVEVWIGKYIPNPRQSILISLHRIDVYKKLSYVGCWGAKILTFHSLYRGPPMYFLDLLSYRVPGASDSRQCAKTAGPLCEIDAVCPRIHINTFANNTSIPSRVRGYSPNSGKSRMPSSKTSRSTSELCIAKGEGSTPLYVSRHHEKNDPVRYCCSILHLLSSSQLIIELLKVLQRHFSDDLSTRVSNINNS